MDSPIISAGTEAFVAFAPADRTISGSDQGTYGTVRTAGASEGRETGGAGEVSSPVVGDEREVAFSFTAGRDDLYAVWNALANLADVADEVSINARATPKCGFDKSQLENGVLEPLRELGLIKDDDSQD